MHVGEKEVRQKAVMEGAIRMEMILPATVENVMAVLCDEIQIRKWSGADAVVDTVEKRLEWFDGQIVGSLLSMSETELSFSCPIDDIADTRFCITLSSERGGDTKMTVTHSGLTPKLNEEMKVFWEEMMLIPLEDYLMVLFHRG